MILNEGQVRLLQQSRDAIVGKGSWEADTEHRSATRHELLAWVERTGVLRGNVLTHSNLAELIKIVRKVQSLQAIVLPRLMGNYEYAVHFKGYGGTRDQFAESMKGKWAGWEEGDTGHPGVDLAKFSRDLASALRSEFGEKFPEALAGFLSHPGVGKGFATGVLNLYDPAKYPLVNNASRAPFEDGGACPLSAAQRQALKQAAAKRFSRERSSLPDGTDHILATMELLYEVKGIVDLADFLLVDWLLFYMGRTPQGQAQGTVRLRYWKIAPGDGAWQWKECEDGGFIALGWDDVGDLSTMDRAEFDAHWDEARAQFRGYGDGAREQMWKFGHDIHKGHWIVANKGTTQVVGIGRVTGPYYYDKDAVQKHRLPVEWQTIGPVTVDEGGWRSTVIELEKAKFDGILELARGKEKVLEPIATGYGTNADYPLSALVEETGFEESLLARWVAAIRRKGQAVLYGPPGTGKTFLARCLAKHLLAGGDGYQDIVQFHPSYSYEEFIQGLRPISGEDQALRYPMVPGRFLEFCQRASHRKGTSVLIIDEMNRANLARVFGELMYLMEYRSETIPLAGGGSLNIPAQVLLIGTMNTADRSIALVDHALRRRFAFLHLAPNLEILRRYHNKTGFACEGLIQAVEKVNATIDDPHYLLGISFFLRPNIVQEVEAIWRMEVEPYLEEYFYDQPEKAEPLRWENIKGLVLA